MLRAVLLTDLLVLLGGFLTVPLFQEAPVSDWGSLFNFGMAGAVMLYTLYLVSGFQKFLKEEAIRRDNQRTTDETRRDAQRTADEARRDTEQTAREDKHREFIREILILHREGLSRVAEEVKSIGLLLSANSAVLSQHDASERELWSRIYSDLTKSSSLKGGA